MTNEESFAEGEIAVWIVGMPGPDMDDCTIVSRNDDGSYNVRYQVWGSGLWHEGIARPGVGMIGGLFKKRPPSSARPKGCPVWGFRHGPR